MKKIDREKKYACRFKDEDAFFVHMRCMLVPGTPLEVRTMKEKGNYEETLTRNMFAAYQILGLYREIKDGDGHAWGTWLEQIRDLNSELMSFIDWKEIKEQTKQT